MNIANQRGLHARAAARFVKLAGRFDAEITVSRGGQEVSGQSIMGLMMLAAVPGSTITVTANGPEEDAALAALGEMVDSKFEED